METKFGIMEHFNSAPFFILTFCSIKSFADIVRDELWFDADFSVITNGRNIDGIIMHVSEVDFARCTLYCVQHVKCHSVNYNANKQRCELCDGMYGGGDGMVDSDKGGWKNYGTPTKQHGGYSVWIDGQCSVTCGIGEKIRYRRCNNPPPRYGGDNCKGPYLQTVCCNTSPCPVAGGYSDWSEFGNCSKSCDVGIQSRMRTCDNPRPSHGGANCSIIGNHTEYRNCSTNPCPGKCSSNHYRNNSGQCVKIEQKLKMNIAFTDKYDQAYNDTNSQKFKDQAKKIEDGLLSPIQATIPEVDAIIVISLTQGSTVASIDMVLKPGTAKGAVKGTNIANKLLTVFKNLKVDGLTPKPNQKIIVVDVSNMALRKPSKQSSIHQPTIHGTFEPAKGNDGNYRSSIVTKWNLLSPWWSVDMQDIVHIDYIAITLNEWAFKQTKPIYYPYLIISTRVKENEAWTLCKRFDPPPSTYLTFKSKVHARYVKVSQDGSKIPMYLQEIEVFGNAIKPVPCPPEKDIDYRGNDIGYHRNTSTWQQCAQKCRNNKDCKYWAWLDTRFKNFANGENTCSLKNKLTLENRSKLDGVWVGSRKCLRP